VSHMSFLAGTRPYLLPPAPRALSPFDPSPRGQPMSADDEKRPDGDSHSVPAIRQTTADVERISERLVPVPVRAGNLLQAAGGQGRPAVAVGPLGCAGRSSR
jgi:hypothetical protein